MLKAQNRSERICCIEKYIFKNLLSAYPYTQNTMSLYVHPIAPVIYYNIDKFKNS